MKSIFIVCAANGAILGCFESMLLAKDSVAISCSEIGCTFEETRFNSVLWVDGNGAKGTIKEYALHNNLQHL
jgi:hypothetical protein